MHGQHQTHAGRQIERQGGLDHCNHALCCPFHPSCQVHGFDLDFSNSSSIFTLTLKKYGHFHFSTGASCLMVRRMGSSKSKPCNWWVFSFYSNLISVNVLIDNLFKMDAFHNNMHYIHPGIICMWTGSGWATPRSLFVLKLIRNNKK